MNLTIQQLHDLSAFFLIISEGLSRLAAQAEVGEIGPEEAAKDLAEIKTNIENTMP